MAFIKSHSNYVLKKNHQTISDGTIWERDITTIGGVNQFSPGQVPIYKSSNFIITVRNDGKVANQYNKTKWKENESGDTWTLETISGMTSEFEDQNDVKIVLKQDYYDFCDFVYYGSLTEMFRASINDVLSRFPGELYVAYELDSSNNKTPINAYYTSGVTSDFEKVEESVILGGSGYTIVSNPFGIDIHSLKKPTDAKALKYFAEDGFKNYEIIDGDDEDGTPITSWESSIEGEFCIGNKIATIKINDSIEIEAWVGDGNEIIYLTNNENLFGKHIRPSQSVVSEFYNECDNFEKLILNRNTTPKYKSVFSVIHDNERGYYREMEEFIFPTSYGGYNIDATSFGFNDYTSRLAEIGAYYDEYFTDNLYRSMTHEAIKNFDWTYTREFTYGDEEEFVHGGEKMQKALRVFAREFDEILSYINNIKNNDRVTYDERSNIPDYFLIDEVENGGWDVCLIYPYDLKEFEIDEYGNYKKDINNNKIVISDENYNEQFQLNGDSNTKFIRHFIQNAKTEVTPYRKELLDYPEGYFITCCDNGGNGIQTCQYNGSQYYFISADTIGNTYVDPCDKGTSSVKNRIKSYSNEKPYTYLDGNNEFMRRMAINSPYIWRHKGTVEGIEMILGMFGLRSKRWVDSMPKYRKDCEKLEPDYEITEYSSFTGRIEEKWDAIHQMYRIDWINSTKAIVYDYRSTSNYTKYGAQSNYVSYQGLPVSYRYEYLSANTPYIKVDSLTACDPQQVTSDDKSAFRVAETNEPVLRRYLYPNFNKDEQLDGNPYFQMDGGWLAKTVEHVSGSTSKKFNFQFDVNDNIAYTCYEESGRTEDDGSLVDNHPIYKETVRNVKRVDNIAELVSTPMENLKYGEIYYVSHIEKDAALINGKVYPIKYEYSGDNDHPSRYILFTKNDEYIKVGDDLFFTDEIFVYNKDGYSGSTSLDDKPSGFEVKAYINSDNSFMCQGDADGYYTIDTFCILDDALPSEGLTNYFIIDNPYYSDKIVNINDSEDSDNNGWKALKETDPEYIKINTIKNYYEGNNPHNGNMNYDSGHEYFTYYKRLFKNPIDESLFDERCYESFFVDLDNEIQNIGFSHLIEDNELIRQYTPFISADTKVHYFGTYYKKGEKNGDGKYICETVMFYGEDREKIEELGKMYKYLNDEISVDSYILSDEENILGKSYPYSGMTEVEYKCGDNTYSVPVDEVTNQIMNNKRLTIKFNLHEKWYSKQGQCELKYLDDIVMNYLTQMIPSTAIVDIQYVSKD